MRLFIGAFLDKDLLGFIPFEDIQKLFEDNLKKINKENIHMTWIFIGNVDDSTRQNIETVIENRLDVFNGLTFETKSLELWPPKKEPRLIVLSGELNREISLDNLNKELRDVCNPDVKDNFLPHITIARFKKDKTVNKKINLPVVRTFSWQIREISLIQSVLTSEGPVYEKIKNWSFKDIKNFKEI